MMMMTTGENERHMAKTQFGFYERHYAYGCFEGLISAVSRSYVNCSL